MTDGQAASALGWWIDAGVDCLVDERPRDWLNAPAAAPPAATAAPPPEPTAPQEELPDQLDLFRAWLGESDALPFAAPNRPRLLPAGDPAAGLMILIGAPLAGDGEAGGLLSGAVGRLFDRMLAAIGRDRASVYLAALSCMRPAGGLSGAEAERCAALARHHIGLAAPKAVLLLGDDAARPLLGLASAQARGRWHDIETPAGRFKALATMSPEILLSSPGLKRHAWADLQMLIEGLAS